jgi:hypothetical protein
VLSTIKGVFMTKLLLGLIMLLALVSCGGGSSDHRTTSTTSTWYCDSYGCYSYDPWDDYWYDYYGYYDYYDYYSCVGSYCYYDGPYYYSENDQVGKDLEKIKAKNEDEVTLGLAEKFQSDYGLSVDRSLKVAKMANAWHKTSKSRKLTANDVSAFSKELLGVDLASVQNAYKAKIEGDDSKVESLIDQAAAKNGTDPENMREIFANFLR